MENDMETTILQGFRVDVRTNWHGTHYVSQLVRRLSQLT